MEFVEDYPKLEPAQKDRFQQVITRLLAGEVLTPGSPLKPDADWRFAERFRELIDSYLRVGGWRFDIDLDLRLARAVHEVGAQRVRFSKLESLLLCSLRLYYHEQIRLASEEERCEISIGVLREPLVHAGKPVAQLSMRALAPAVRRFARHSLVQVTRGFEGRDDEFLVVMPLVKKVLPADRIQEIEQKIKAYVASRTATPTAELLLGDNGSGKTTVLDAIQVTAVGDLSEASPNKAANDKSSRSWYGYVLSSGRHHFPS